MVRHKVIKHITSSEEAFRAEHPSSPALFPSELIEKKQKEFIDALIEMVLSEGKAWHIRRVVTDAFESGKAFEQWKRDLLDDLNEHTEKCGYDEDDDDDDDEEEEEE
jgi:hypothetical protein